MDFSFSQREFVATAENRSAQAPNWTHTGAPAELKDFEAFQNSHKISRPNLDEGVQITHKPTMIHLANPDHSELAVPQSLYLGNRQQLAEVISQHPHFKYPNEIDLALNLGLHIRFYW